MFENVGRKIQIVAKVATWIEFFLSFVGGCVLFFFMSSEADFAEGAAFFYTLWMFILCAVGFGVVCLLFWLINLPLFAFGKMAEDIGVIRNDYNGKKPQNHKEEAKTNVKKSVSDNAQPSNILKKSVSDNAQPSNILSKFLKKIVEFFEIIRCVGVYTPENDDYVNDENVEISDEEESGEEKIAAEVKAERNEAWEKAAKSQGVKVGQCEKCGKKRKDLLFVEFEDFFGKVERNVCQDCFVKFGCKPKKH